MLTTDQKLTNLETITHITRVRDLINQCVVELLSRGEKHDKSKLSSPEVEVFTEFTPRLSSLDYGSDEYNQCREKMDSALIHHYSHNRHHPEHFSDGVDDMNLIDLLEMIVDWKAASERHASGNVYNSVIINTDRFKLSPQLVKILNNTIDYLF